MKLPFWSPLFSIKLYFLNRKSYGMRKNNLDGIKQHIGGHNTLNRIYITLLDFEI